MSIVENIAARNAWTTTLGGKPAITTVRQPVIALTAAQASDALFGIAYKQPGMPTLEDCRRILTEIHEKRGALEVDAVLSRFGVFKLRDLFTGMYQDFYDYCHAILTYGACPYYGWNLDGIPYKVRDRWLFWHPESESLFEERKRMGEAELERLLSEGVEDVTGDPVWEERYAAQKSTENL